MNKPVKQYGTAVKAAAVILLALAPIVLITSLSAAFTERDMASFGSYYRWEITDAASEKQSDGKYLITMDIKNTSAYRATISDYSVIVRYGNNSSADNKLLPDSYPRGEFYDIFRYPVVPAGQTVKYRMLVELPEGTSTVRLDYRGTSYDLSEISGEDSGNVYTLKLD
ncbi:MAG: hypothetical protein NC395_07450 [Prevotella sp.]|nr:hypothetical protein [Prevotella sp.]